MVQCPGYRRSIGRRPLAVSWSALLGSSSAWKAGALDLARARAEKAGVPVALRRAVRNPNRSFRPGQRTSVAIARRERRARMLQVADAFHGEASRAVAPVRSSRVDRGAPGDRQGIPGPRCCLTYWALSCRLAAAGGSERSRCSARRYQGRLEGAVAGQLQRLVRRPASRWPEGSRALVASALLLLDLAKEGGSRGGENRKETDDSECEPKCGPIAWTAASHRRDPVPVEH